MTALLHGVKVLDLTRMLAGPYCTLVLADLGADVIKVEDMRIGDPTRRNLPMHGGESAYFMALNRGKRSLALDMKSADGLALIRDLIKEADVLIENFRPGVTARLGIGFAAAFALNPRLIYCSLSGFGASGPDRHHISFDLINQAMAGYIESTGSPDGPGVRVGVPIGDMAGGLYTAIAALAGLVRREKSGQGMWFDIALHDVLIDMLHELSEDYGRTGQPPVRSGQFAREGARHGCYATTDGWIAVDARADAAWSALLAAFDVQCADDGSQDAVTRELAAAIALQSSASVISELCTRGVPCAPVNSVKDALEMVPSVARDLRFVATHASIGQMENLASPLIVNGERAGLGTVSPILGESSDAIEASRGFDQGRTPGGGREAR